MRASSDDHVLMTRSPAVITMLQSATRMVHEDKEPVGTDGAGERDAEGRDAAGCYAASSSHPLTTAGRKH